MLPYRLGLSLTSVIGVCALCERAPIDDGYLCEICECEFDFTAKQFLVALDNNKSLPVYFSTFYTHLAKNALSAFKDHENLQTLPFLMHSLYRLSQTLDLPSDTVILPVPTTDRRLVERGFYPVGILAEYFSYLTGFEIYEGVSRPTEGRHQRGLGRHERLDNLNDAFVLDYPPDAKHVLIFDDVSTTGATFKAVAQALAGCTATLQAACLLHGSPDFYYARHIQVDDD